MIALAPISNKAARAYVEEHHRHLPPPKLGYFFSIAVADTETSDVVGVVIVGRPIAIGNDDGLTAEILRCCTDGTKNACSMLYSAAWRAARAMGYRRLITYTLVSEPGTSLKAAGFKCLGEVKYTPWNRKNRPRLDTAPHQNKLKWGVTAQ